MSDDRTFTVTVPAAQVAGMDDDAIAKAVRPSIGEFNRYDVEHNGDQVTVTGRVHQVTVADDADPVSVDPRFPTPREAYQK